MFKKLLTLIFLSPLVASEDYASEYEINQKWCSKMKGEQQFRTKDGTYVDCLTEEFAIEADYDYNWKEGIGQALHYAETTNKKAAILFIKRQKSNKDYLSELNRVITKFELPLEVFIVEDY